MGAGHNNLRRKKNKQQCKVGHEEEGSSSNRPELALFLLALRGTLIEEPLLYLCDNQSLLKAVTRWIGEGGKASLVGSPDADILAAAIEILRKRIAAGTATFLLKVKAYRREPANEGADILADKAISDPKVCKEWCQGTNRAVFTWKKQCRKAGKVTDLDRHSTFDNSARDAIRRGARLYPQSRLWEFPTTWTYLPRDVNNFSFWAFLRALQQQILTYLDRDTGV